MMRRNRTARFLTGLLAVFCSLCILVSCASVGPRPDIALDVFETWDIHTEAQAAYLASDNWTKIPSLDNAGMAENSKPVLPVFSWSYSKSIGSAVKSATLFFSDNPSFASALEFKVEPGETTFAIPVNSINLMVNTAYYWYVAICLEDGTEMKSETAQFTTLGGIRNISIDGVANCRDMGGYTVEGGVVRQGLLYRTGRYNVKYSTDKLITDKGLEQMKELGIRTDIDLRGDKSNVDANGNRVFANGYNADGSEEMKSPLGDDVVYVFAPAVWSSSLLMTTEGEEMIKKVFEVLSDESSYPVVFHCSIGTDRTGVSAFLIGCALGMSDIDLKRDYMFSNFGRIETTRASYDFNASTSAVTKHPGNTLAQKGVAYLLGIGVTEEQIEKIRQIMIEKK